MKQLTKGLTIKNFIALVLLSLIQIVVLAQDSTSTTSTTSVKVTKEETTNWLSSPWVWVIGGAVFILLLVALLGGSKSKTTAGSSDRVTVTKTVQRDTDTDV